MKLHLAKRTADTSFDTLCRRTVDADHRLAVGGEYVNCGRCKDLDDSINRFTREVDGGGHRHKGTHAEVEFNERLAEYRDDVVEP